MDKDRRRETGKIMNVFIKSITARADKRDDSE
jgi:hypothetical protein